MRKKIVSLILVILLLVQLPVYGQTPEETGFDVETMMEFILNNYAGSEIDEETLYYGALKGMFQTLDGYSEFYTPEEFDQLFEDLSDSFYGIGAELRLSQPYAEVGAVYVGSPAEAAGLLTGDLITAVDGQSVEGLSLNEMVYLIRGELGTEVVLTIQRGQNVLDLTIVRGEINTSEVFTVDLNDHYSSETYESLDKVQYVSVGQFSLHVAEDFEEVVREAVLSDKDYMIIDLRNNPGGYLEPALELSRLLVPEGPILYLQDVDGEEEVYYSNLKRSPFKQLVILTNGNSASASEVLASAVQDSGSGILIGEQTYGKGVVQNIFHYKESGFKLTTHEYLTRDHHRINHIGLTPDIEVNSPEYIPEMFMPYSEGMNDDYVLMIEEVLLYLGYLDEADTNYDEKTTNGIKAFQETVELEITGISDAKTIESLNETLYNYYLEYDPTLERALQYFDEFDENLKN